MEGTSSATEAQAVYRCFSEDGQLLYIGTSGHLGRRLAAHAGKIWFREVFGITLEWYSNERLALIAEKRHIRIEHPKYNIVYAKTGPSLQPRKQALRRADDPRTLRPSRVDLELRDLIWEALQVGPLDGVAPKDLLSLTLRSSTLIYEVITAWRGEGKVEKVRQGRYRLTPAWQGFSWRDEPGAPEMRARAESPLGVSLPKSGTSRQHH